MQPGGQTFRPFGCTPQYMLRRVPRSSNEQGIVRQTAPSALQLHHITAEARTLPQISVNGQQRDELVHIVQKVDRNFSSPCAECASFRPLSSSSTLIAVGMTRNDRVLIVRCCKDAQTCMSSSCSAVGADKLQTPCRHRRLLIQSRMRRLRIGSCDRMAAQGTSPTSSLHL